MAFLYKHFGHSVWPGLLQGRPEDIDVYRWRPLQYIGAPQWPKIRNQRQETQLHNQPRASSTGVVPLESSPSAAEEGTQCFYQSTHPDWGHDLTRLQLTKWGRSPTYRHLCSACLAYFQTTNASMRVVT